MTRALPELQEAAARLMRSVIPRPESRVPEMAALLEEVFDAGQAFERSWQALPPEGVLRVCWHCGNPVRPQGPRPDWAAAVAGYPFPVLFCPGRGDGDFPVHEPAEVPG